MAAPYIQQRVEAFIAERKDLIDKAIDTYLTEKALALAIAGRMNYTLEMALQQFLEQIRR